MRTSGPILAIIIALATWTMWPALATPSTTMVCNWMHPDCISNNWLLVWVAEQLAAGESIAHNDRYYWPIGDAPVLAGNGSEGVLYSLLHWLLGWPTASVWYLWAILILNGLGGWALGRALGAAAWPAVLPAAVAICSPYLLGELSGGRYSQVSIGWMLMTLAAWLSLLDRPDPRRAILAGGLWAITAFFYWFYAWFVAMALAVMLLNHWLTHRSLPWRNVGIAGLTAALLIAPWAWLFAQAWTAIPGTSEAFPPSHALQDSVWPSVPFLHQGQADTAGMGVVPWLLGLMGAGATVMRSEHRARWALVCWLGFTLLAMGPFVRWAPYTLVYDLAPPLRRFWWPLRHIVVAGVLWASLGAVWLSARRWASPIAAVSALSLPAMLYAAGLPHQVHTTRLDLQTPGVQAMTDLEPGVILQLPVAPEASGTQLPLLLQIVHGHTMLGGHAQWVDRVRPAAWDAQLAQNSYLDALRRLELGQIDDQILDFKSDDLKALQQAGLRWLVLDRTTFPLGLRSAAKAHRAAADALFGSPVYQSREVRIWDLHAWQGQSSTAVPQVVWTRGLVPAGPQAPLTGRWPHPPVIVLDP